MITQQVSLNQGESITIQPASMNGTWTYDEKLLSITQNGDSYTVTAIKEGTATAVYTTDTTQTTLDINVHASHVPNTNDSMRIYMIIAIVSLLGFVLIKMYQKRID